MGIKITQRDKDFIVRMAVATANMINTVKLDDVFPTVPLEEKQTVLTSLDQAFAGMLNIARSLKLGEDTVTDLREYYECTNRPAAEAVGRVGGVEAVQPTPDKPS